jgi:hypothetical protein
MPERPGSRNRKSLEMKVDGPLNPSVSLHIVRDGQIEAPSRRQVTMRAWLSLTLFFGGLVMLTSACATSEEWSDWRGHNSHFASGTHGVFSLRNNRDGSNPRVSRTDVDAARQENWWGKAITVSPEQIFQN